LKGHGISLKTLDIRPFFAYILALLEGKDTMRERFFAILLVSTMVFHGSCRQMRSQTATTDTPQSRLDRHCAEVGKENFSGSEKLTRVEAFYSWKINTCVQIEVDNEFWSYTLRDVTHGFFSGLGWTKTEIPLKVYDEESIGWASAEGFWKSTDSGEDKQLVGQIAAKIVCNRDEGICRESDATIFMGILSPDSHEYAISTWTRAGIVADDTDEGTCAIGHRLSIDFKNNSVIVTDYPKKMGGNEFCKAFQNANSYSLRGGQLMLYQADNIFGCTSHGANSAILAKVSEFHGAVADKTYRLWMDNGEGGLPATVQTPKHPYTRSDCEKLMEKKLRELKAQ
jgi:hypothetical protein